MTRFAYFSTLIAFGIAFLIAMIYGLVAQWLAMAAISLSPVSILLSRWRPALLPAPPPTNDRKYVRTEFVRLLVICLVCLVLGWVVDWIAQWAGTWVILTWIVLCIAAAYLDEMVRYGRTGSHGSNE